ncbi:hypothetical protein KAU08_06970 [bacterium]|nr:hypothetical protein [bacterium]
MHVVFSKDERCLDGIEAEELDEYKLAGLLGMTVTEGPLLPGPILKGHWRGFTVEITVAPRVLEYEETVHMFPQPPEFQITFHLTKTSDIELGIRHRAIEATGLVRPLLRGKKRCMLPPDFGRDFIVRGPSTKAAKMILDEGMQELIRRLEKFGPPELAIDYSLLVYRGIGNFIERYREIPTLLGNLVEIGRLLDSKLTIMLRDLS